MTPQPRSSKLDRPPSKRKGPIQLPPATMTKRALLVASCRFSALLPDQLFALPAAASPHAHHVFGQLFRGSPPEGSTAAARYSDHPPAEAHIWRRSPPAALNSLNPTRAFSASSPDSLSEDALRAEVDTINDKFAEARDEIEMALESKDTVYFNEEASAAREAVQSVLERFSSLLGRLDEDRKGALQRSMGLKMEQLKGELEQLNHDHE